MTVVSRREKHLRIIEHFDVPDYRQFERFTLEHKHGLTLFTDEAIEEFACFLVNEARFKRRLIKGNKERAAQAR